jgi:hypothetical protein
VFGCGLFGSVRIDAYGGRPNFGRIFFLCQKGINA